MPLGSVTLPDGLGALTIPDSSTVTRTIPIGSASWIRVVNIRVNFSNLSHTFPGDLDFLLIGPDGRNLEFWSDVGDFVDIVNGNFTISDAGASSLSENGANPSGTYKPTDYTGTQPVETSSNWSGLPSMTINHPGPAGSATFASAFGGAWIPNSSWTLKVRDDDPTISGSLGGWSITFDYRLIVKPHDFDNNQFSDIVFQNNDGTPGIWTMNGFVATSVGPAGPNAPWPSNPGPSWKVKGDGDFNDDGRSDILWQNLDGAAGVWLMNGLTATAMSTVGTNPGPSWQIKGTADFNFDGKADILWQNLDGTPGIWLMNGFSVLASGTVGTNPGPAWQVKAAADFNGDGKTDILWQNLDGTPGIWLMDGLNVIGVGQPHTNPGPNWQIKGTGDFNNDGNADILWQHTDGTAAIWLMDGLTALNVGTVGTNPGTSWHIMGSGDYNGDHNSDILWQKDDGTPGIWFMSGLSLLGAGVAGSFNPGPEWHIIG
jgi:hypothetical protein